jgi:O-antigen/teichoic acid export membrane protein
MNFRKNAVLNVAEVVVSGLSLLVIYRVIVSHLGTSALGLWTLVMAATAIGRLADPGAAGGLQRLVAIAQSKRTPNGDVMLSIETAILGYGAFYGLLCAPLYLVASLLLRQTNSVGAQELLPLGIASFFLSSLNTVFVSALIGLGRSGARSVVAIAAMAVNFALAVSLMPAAGIRAVAVANIGQLAFSCVGNWCVINGYAPRELRRLFPRRFSNLELRGMLGLGFRMQALSISGMTFDPLVKFTLSATCGLAGVGTYEMASRFIQQIRQIIIAPAMNIAPMFSQNEHARSKLQDIYSQSATWISIGGAVFFAVTSASAPIASIYWFHKINYDFISASFLLSIGWLLNILSAPGYLLGMGLGQVRWNIAGTLATSAISAGLCYAGAGLGYSSTVAGISVGIGIGAVLSSIANCRVAGLSAFPSPHQYVSILRKPFRSGPAPERAPAQL